MSGTALALPEERRYIEAVRAELGDLPAEDRDELLADVEVSVHEAAAEDASSIASRLGPPAAFAAELRAAAGYPSAPGPAAQPWQTRAQRLLGRLERFAAHPRVRRARELAPIWWVARAYVAVAAVALLNGGGFAEGQPLLPTPAAPMASVFLLLLAVAGSVWLGLRRTGGRRLAVLDAALAVAAVLVALAVLENPRVQLVYYGYLDPAAEMAAGTGLYKDGAPVRNLYVYTRDGRMLLDALVYDANGTPVEIPALPGADPLRRPVFDSKGREVFNAFPIRYFEPGTRRILDPRAAPRVDLPRIVTPRATEQRLRR